MYFAWVSTPGLVVPWILSGKAKARHVEPQGTTFSIYLAEVDRYTKKIHNVLSRALCTLAGTETISSAV